MGNDLMRLLKGALGIYLLSESVRDDKPDKTATLSGPTPVPLRPGAPLVIPTRRVIGARLGDPRVRLPADVRAQIAQQLQQGEVRRDGTLRPLPKIQFRPVRSIKDRLDILAELINGDSLTSETLMEARLVVGQRCSRDGRQLSPTEVRNAPPRSVKWCIRERDSEGESGAVFDAMQDAGSEIGLRYTGDHADVDTYAKSSAMRFAPAEDCDGGIVRAGALLKAIGFQVYLIAALIGPVDQGNGHVWLRVAIPREEPTYLKAFDWTVPEPFGWEYPGVVAFQKTKTPDEKVPADRRVMDVFTRKV